MTYCSSKILPWPMKNSNILYPIFLSIALLIGIIIGVVFDFPTKTIALSDYNQREEKLRQIINYIDYEYVDELNTDSILDATIASLMRQLDPHSSYIPVDQVEASTESMRGSFSGIGIEFKIIKDTLTVVRVIEDGPAERAGLKQGDRILAAGDKQLFGYGLSSDEVVHTLKGEAGSRVALSVYSQQRQGLDLITVKRGDVPINSVQGSFMLDEETAYIKLVRFAERSGDELRTAIKKLKRRGAKKLVLDLRDNPGGLLSVAREVTDQFLEKGELIVFTKDRDGETNELYATSRGAFEDGKLAVLINEGSASASEILAGALQDNDRAWIVGRRSFGKGLVQEEMTLQDGSKIRLTTSRYYTPSGRSIQKPFAEYGVQGEEESFHARELRKEAGEGTEYHTRSGRTVFGGGGIKPDVEVPMDTSRSAAILYHLSMLTNFNEKSFSYVDENRTAFKGMSQDEFMQEWKVDDEVLSYFFGTAMARIKIQTEETRELIKGRIKAFIAYNLYGNGAFQEAYAPYDPTIREAQQILNENRLMKK